MVEDASRIGVVCLCARLAFACLGEFVHSKFTGGRQTQRAVGNEFAVTELWDTPPNSHDARRPSPVARRRLELIDECAWHA